MTSLSSPAAPRPPSLYDISGEWAALEAALLDSGGEVTPEVEAAFTALGELEGAAVDRYAAVVRSLGAYADACKAEETHFRDKRKAAEGAIVRLKERVLDYMRQRDVKELRGPTARAARQKNGGLRPMELLVPAEELPSAFTVTTIGPDWPAIRAAIGDNLPPDNVGEVLTLPGDRQPAVEIRPVGEHVRFR